MFANISGDVCLRPEYFFTVFRKSICNFFIADKSMAKISPIQFFRQVKQEVKKVTWPTKNEVVRTSIMVIIIVAIAATFFFFVDQILGWIIKLILGVEE